MRLPVPGHLLLVLVATGCAQGVIHWDTGADDLRTAWFVTDRLDDGPAHAAVFLSTGLFECGIPASEDPQAQSEALAALTVGACREDARHVIIDLYKAPGLDWEGRYAFLSEESPEEVTGRGSEARYVGIDEAIAARSDGLVPVYVPTEVTRYDAVGAPGDVAIQRSEEQILAGAFDLPGVGVSGRFTAIRCGEDTSLFDLLVASPIAACTLAPDG